MSLAGFADYLGVTALTAEQNRCYGVAETMVEQALYYEVTTVPSNVRDQLVLDVAADLARRSEGTSGQYEAVDGNRAPNDPLQRVRAVLKRYTVSGI